MGKCTMPLKEQIHSKGSELDHTHHEFAVDEPIDLKELREQSSLIPIPSDDPNDPLRTPAWRKNAALVALSCYTAGSLAVTTSLSPIIPTLIQYYGAIGIPGRPSPQDVMNLGTYPTLFGGIGAIISIVAARWIGTRPVLMSSAALLFCATAWSCVSRGGDRGLHSNTAARCFIGLGGGAYESLVPLIVQDMNYIHKRNRALALVWGSGGMIGATFGAISTYIVAGLNWRWMYWIINIVNGMAMVLIFLYVPETTWPRRMSDLTGTSEIDSSGFTKAMHPPQPRLSYARSLRLYSGQGSAESAWNSAKDLARCAVFPNVIWIVLLNACMSGTTIATTLVISTTLQNSYHWAPENTGLCMFAVAVGSILTFPITGIFGDHVQKVLGKRAQTGHRPEHQLVNLILPVTSGFIGTLVYGVVYKNPEKYHWSLMLVMMAFQFFASTSINIISTTYSIECYPDLAGVMVIVCGAYRNIVGFGLTYGAQSFIDVAGPLGCFGTYAGLQGGLGLIGLFFYFKGPAVRRNIETWKIRRPSLNHEVE